MIKWKYIQRLDFRYTGSHWYNLSEVRIQGGAKGTHVFEMGSSRESEAISFFGVTLNQKSTFENLVHSTI